MRTIREQRSMRRAKHPVTEVWCLCSKAVELACNAEKERRFRPPQVAESFPPAIFGFFVQR
jgi:hypothetical protein